LLRVARILAEHRPGTLIWRMGAPRFHIGNNKKWAVTILSQVLGNVGKEGGGPNTDRRHHGTGCCGAAVMRIRHCRPPARRDRRCLFLRKPQAVPR